MGAPNRYGPREEALRGLGGLVTDWAMRLTGADGASVTLFEGMTFRYIGAAGSAASYLGREQPLDQSFTGEVLATGRPRIFNPDAAGEASRERAKSSHIASGIVVPVLTGGRPAGTIGVVSQHSGAFEQRHVAVLEPLAKLCGNGFVLALAAKWLDLASAPDPFAR